MKALIPNSLPTNSNADPCPYPADVCLSLAFGNDALNMAQLYEICEALDLALEFLARAVGGGQVTETSLKEAFEISANGRPGPPPPGGLGIIRLVNLYPGETQDTAIGLVECWRDRLLPALKRT